MPGSLVGEALAMTEITDFAAILLVIGAGDNVVRLIPPLVVSDAEIAEAVRRLDAACADLSAVPVKAAS